MKRWFSWAVFVLPILLLLHTSGCTTPRIRTAYQNELRDLIAVETAGRAIRGDFEKPAGAAEMAAADVADGFYIVPVGGYPRRSYREPVFQELEKRYGIEIDCISGCVAPQALFDFLAEYRTVTCDAIQAKWGRTLDELIDETVNRPHVREAIELEDDARRREQLAQEERLRDELDILFAAGDLPKAYRQYGDDFSDIAAEYARYLRSTPMGATLTDEALSIRTLIVPDLELHEAMVGDVVQFLAELQKEHFATEAYHPIVLRLPPEDLSAKISYKGGYVPLSIVLNLIVTRTGCEMSLDGNTVILHKTTE